MPTEKTTKVLIGIVTTNELRFTLQCLDSVPASAKHNSLKVILVDNCSSDRAAEIVRDRYSWVEVVERECNYSFAANNNVAFARYASEYFLMLNPDTVLGEGAVDTLVKFMEGHPDCGACGPKLVFPDGSLQYSCRRFPTVWSTLLRRSPIRLPLPGDRSGRRHLMVSVSHDHEMQVDWMLGACVLVRRGAIEGTKLLDEGFPYSCEDIDLFRRLKKGGWTTYYVPSTTVIHHLQAKIDSKFFCRENLLHAKGMMHFIGKHYLSPQPDTAESSGVRIRQA